MTLKKNNNERGFTIVELLIVIIVIGILATLVLIAYGNVQGQARDTKRQSNAQSVATAAENFRTASSAGTYPDMSSGANFQAMINNTALYTNGVAATTVDASVTASGATSLLSVIATKGPATNTNNNANLMVYYCPAAATNTTATGMQIYYWNESANTGTKYVQTGTGC